MTSPDGPGRHLTLAQLNRYLANGQRAIVPVTGTPRAELVVEPARNSLALEVAYGGEPLPDMSAFANVTVSVVNRESVNWSRLEVTGDSLMSEALPLLTSVADRVQTLQESFGVAVGRTFTGFDELLATMGRMTVEQEIGLLGELAVLERLVGTRGGPLAVDCWLGAAGSEHDFALPECDLEVKTTTGERRRHWVHGLTQLLPSHGRPLFLLSLQVTLADGAPGRSLADQVALVREMVPGDAGDRFDVGLRKLGWRDDQSHRYSRVFRLRSAPLCVDVNDTLPRLTVADLARAGVDSARIHRVNYEIDLTGLPRSVASPLDVLPERFPS